MRIELQSATRRRRRRRQRSVSFVPAWRPPEERRSRRPRLPSAAPLAILASVLLLAVAYVAFALLRSAGEPTVSIGRLPTALAGRSAFSWPAQGEAALAIYGSGGIAVHGSGRSTPIASVAKVMTAYVILRDHPLKSGANGPALTVSAGDLRTYRLDVALGESAVAVRTGERLSERQALEGLLLPSGNNMATLLARWDAGSQAAFVAKMNQAARGLGLTRTRYADASGVDPRSVSTANDQVRLAIRALTLPVFRQIVGLTQVTLPVAGREYNVDALLGRDGVVGIKTGTTSSAGGCFVFAADEPVAGHAVTVVGAVLHQLPGRTDPSLITAAFQATTALLRSVPGNLILDRVVPRGAVVARITAPWTGPVALRAARSISLIGWRGTPLRVAVVAGNRHPSAGQRAGAVTATAGRLRLSDPLLASSGLPGPSLLWRLEHP